MTASQRRWFEKMERIILEENIKVDEEALYRDNQEHYEIEQMKRK